MGIVLVAFFDRLDRHDPSGRNDDINFKVDKLGRESGEATRFPVCIAVLYPDVLAIEIA